MLNKIIKISKLGKIDNKYYLLSVRSDVFSQIAADATLPDIRVLHWSPHGTSFFSSNVNT